MIEVEILADSVAPNGKRLTTIKAKYPRAIHSEIMTHRMLSRNSASSRAIPTHKLVNMIIDDPWIPEYIGAAQKGMQAGEELPEDVRAKVVEIWLSARKVAVVHALRMLELNAPKQVVNRILEPWMWITVIMSATEWNNMDALRDHPAAEPHFQHLQRLIKTAREHSTPNQLQAGEWHLPYISEEDKDVAARMVNPSLTESVWRNAYDSILIRASVGRCARVSYLTQDGQRSIDKDIELHDRLILQNPMHASPAEHQAMALNERNFERSGNFIGWRQYRKTLPNECVEG